MTAPQTTSSSKPVYLTKAEKVCHSVSEKPVYSSEKGDLSIFEGKDSSKGVLSYASGQYGCTVIDKDGNATYTFENNSTKEATTKQKWGAKTYFPALLKAGDSISEFVKTTGSIIKDFFTTPF